MSHAVGNEAHGVVLLGGDVGVAEPVAEQIEHFGLAAQDVGDTSCTRRRRRLTTTHESCVYETAA
jgi:hypothetical protein